MCQLLLLHQHQHRETEVALAAVVAVVVAVVAAVVARQRRSFGRRQQSVRQHHTRKHRTPVSTKLAHVRQMLSASLARTQCYEPTYSLTAGLTGNKWPLSLIRPKARVCVCVVYLWCVYVYMCVFSRAVPVSHPRACSRAPPRDIPISSAVSVMHTSSSRARQRHVHVTASS
jgi:Flp pilus assembly protein TadB